jgi:hypothetical protein
MSKLETVTFRCAFFLIFAPHHMSAFRPNRRFEATRYLRARPFAQLRQVWPGDLLFDHSRCSGTEHLRL